jgi:hypothetical protein
MRHEHEIFRDAELWLAAAVAILITAMMIAWLVLPQFPG